MPTTRAILTQLSRDELLGVLDAYDLRVKRLLRKHGYPPDKRDEAVVTVIEQAEAVCRDWAEAA